MLGRHSGFAEAPPTFCQPSMGWYHGSKGAGSRHARCDAQVTTLAGILMRGSRQGPAHSPRVARPRLLEEASQPCGRPGAAFPKE